MYIYPYSSYFNAENNAALVPISRELVLNKFKEIKARIEFVRMIHKERYKDVLQNYKERYGFLYLFKRHLTYEQIDYYLENYSIFNSDPIFQLKYAGHSTRYKKMYEYVCQWITGLEQSTADEIYADSKMLKTLSTIIPV